MDVVLVLLCGLLGLAVSLLALELILMSGLGKAQGGRCPDFHQTHTTPVPRLGGIAFALVFVLIAAICFVWIPVSEAANKTRWVIVGSSLAMFLLGLWDDIRPLGARKKLFGQILIAAAACYGGIRVEQLQLPFMREVVNPGSFGYVLTVFWLVALTNVINLIDGLDGLAGGVAAMLMGLLVYVGWGAGLVFPTLCAAAIYGALLAFLKLNFPPARIYMGDGGAYFLGYLIGILALVYSQKGTVLAALIAPAFALALPILDTTLAVLRRGLRGLPIFRADRGHIHHRLLAKGLSRRRVVLTLYGFSLLFLLVAFAMFVGKGVWVPLLFGCACLVFLALVYRREFMREWLELAGTLSGSAETRKETRYALALGNCLFQEAEQAKSVEQLWSDFQFLVRKVGFARVTLTLGDGQRVWASPEAPPGEPDQKESHEVNGGGAAKIEFAAWSSRISPGSFQHLSEISAECWHKTAQRWHAHSRLPLRFDSRFATGECDAEARKSGLERITAGD